MKIARVFARKTKMTPTGPDIYFGTPDLFTPKYDLVLINVTFTWDILRAKHLQMMWSLTAKTVLLGGPAVDPEPPKEFVGGKFLKQGVTITSRGCPNRCPHCLVPDREGKIYECKDFPAGNVVQDNNILACSRRHLDRVFKMLRSQTGVAFQGGLEAGRVTPAIAEELRGLRITDLWLSCDTRGSLRGFKKAVQILHRAGFSRYQLRSYVLIGDDMKENTERLLECYQIGTLPFAQLRQPEDWKEYSDEWKATARFWSLPAIYKTQIKYTGGVKWKAQAVKQ